MSASPTIRSRESGNCSASFQDRRDVSLDNLQRLRTNSSRRFETRRTSFGLLARHASELSRTGYVIPSTCFLSRWSGRRAAVLESAPSRNLNDSVNRDAGEVLVQSVFRASSGTVKAISSQAR
jgi:hypothetical protein